MLSNQDYNCAGFAFGTMQWEIVWSPYFFNYAYEVCKEAREANPNLSTLECHNIEVAAVLDAMIQECEFEFNCKHIEIDDIASAPIGTIAMRITHNVFRSDFHFARKELLDGEPCWLHKQGKSPVDIMFDEDIIAPEWEGGYDSDIVYFIKEDK